MGENKSVPECQHETQTKETILECDFRANKNESELLETNSEYFLRIWDDS